MTLKDLSKRAGVSLPTAAQAEKRESEGIVSIETLKKMAAAMECDFVYAFVPKASFGTILKNRATERAREILSQADTHMALEDQAVQQNLKSRITRLSKKLLQNGNVW